MRIFEVANSQNQSTPVVYVDMDGVLADMFGAVADQEGAPHWRKARKIKDRIDQVAQEPGFFRELKPLKNAGRFLRGVVDLAGKYSILSSPLMSQEEQSVREKSDWITQYLGSMPPQATLFDHNKERYAQQPDETPNILIDDWEANIRLWEANGGIGILYTPENYARVLKQLKHALMHGRSATNEELDQDDPEPEVRPRLLTSRQVLKYIKGIHHEYSLDKPVLKHKTWVLHRVPVSELNQPEFYDQDDPYRRVIDLDWDHIDDVTRHDIEHRPVVADENGWLLDGNHRATKARVLGMSSIPAITPYQEDE